VHTFEVVRWTVPDVLTATDEQLVAPTQPLATYLKLLVELAGALGLAALLANLGHFRQPPRRRGHQPR